MEKYTKVLNKLFNAYSKGVDMYQNDGSLWLIFTENKRWVIELSDNGTLWYNYKFFNDIFKMVSLEMIENQHYITKWVEDALQNGVNHTQKQIPKRLSKVEDALQNGVKRTWMLSLDNSSKVEDALQNGVKNTRFDDKYYKTSVDDVIQNGVKNTYTTLTPNDFMAEHVIKNGVKTTKSFFYNGTKLAEEVIKNGVKNALMVTDMSTYYIEEETQDGVKDTQLFTGIQNGIKTIEPGGYLGFCVIRGKKVHQFESAKQYNEVEWVIINGIKQTKTPGDMDIELTMEWMEENETSSVPKLIDYVINYGLKKTCFIK